MIYRRHMEPCIRRLIWLRGNFRFPFKINVLKRILHTALQIVVFDSTFEIIDLILETEVRQVL